MTPAPVIVCAGDRLRRAGGAGGADPLQPRAIGAVDVAGQLGGEGNRQRPVFGVIGDDLAARAVEHVAIGVIGKLNCADLARGVEGVLVGNKGPDILNRIQRTSESVRYLFQNFMQMMGIGSVMAVNSRNFREYAKYSGLGEYSASIRE
ncbi:MAG: hypothetical protein ACT4N9_03930 [Paracoccaceae bacterium]